MRRMDRSRVGGVLGGLFIAATAAAAPLLGGCDPMSSIDANIIVPADVQALYSDANPGQLLVRDPLDSGVVLRVATLCDASTLDVVVPYHSHDYGCLSGPADFEVWIEPLPISPGTAPACGELSTPEELFGNEPDADEPYAVRPVFTDPDHDAFRCPTARESFDVSLPLPGAAGS